MTQQQINRTEFDTLAALFYDNALIPQVRDGYSGEAPAIDWGYFQDPNLRTVAKAVWQLDDEKRPVTVSTVLAQLGSGADPSIQRLVSRIDDQALPVRVDTLGITIERIATTHNRTVLDRLLRASLANLEADPDNPLSVANAAMEQLGAVGITGVRRRSGRIGDIMATGKYRETSIGRPIGLAWLDDPGDPRTGRPGMIGGLGKGEKLVITGLYGGRKTSTGVYFTSQMALPIRKPNPATGEYEIVTPAETVGYFQLDDNRDTLTSWYLAQMASAWLRAKGYSARDTAISALGIAEDYRTAAQHQGITWAEKRLARMPIIIRDTEDGVDDFEEMLRQAREMVLVDGVTTIVIDYIQAMSVKGIREIRERMEYMTQKLNAFAARYGASHGVKLIVMSQRPENVNATGAGGDSAGLKGGGDLAAFASYILQTRSSTEAPTEFFIKTLKARFARRGVEMPYTVIPENGLIIDPDKIPTFEAPV